MTFHHHHHIQDQVSLGKLKDFLGKNNLPTEDIRQEGGLFYTYHDGDGMLVGSGGLELHGRHALLRSVAVEQSHRGKSLGQRIVYDLIGIARNKNLEDVYLLTETAAQFFRNRGFTDVQRETVPDEIRTTSEYSQVCPSSAIVMKFTLRQ